MWTQRDKLFSRWKERYFVLTREYLNCFKKGTSRISEMGEFLYKVRNERNYAIIVKKSSIGVWHGHCKIAIESTSIDLYRDAVQYSYRCGNF